MNDFSRRPLNTTPAVASLMSLQLVPATASKPNILMIFGNDIDQSNIDRPAKEGMKFNDYYAENPCTAGRSSFTTSQTSKRTGLTKVEVPGATVGLQYPALQSHKR